MVYNQCPTSFLAACYACLGKVESREGKPSLRLSADRQASSGVPSFAITQIRVTTEKRQTSLPAALIGECIRSYLAGTSVTTYFSGCLRVKEVCFAAHLPPKTQCAAPGRRDNAFELFQRSSSLRPCGLGEVEISIILRGRERTGRGNGSRLLYRDCHRRSRGNKRSN